MKDGLGRVQSVLVLGGDSDIGAAICRRFARHGTRNFLLAGRNLERLETRAAGIHELGASRIETVSFDADATESHGPILTAAFERFGGFDVVVVAFGVLGEQAVAERDATAAVAVAQTNYVGAVSVLVQAGELLRRQGHGTLVLLSSVAGQRPRKSNFVYGSSKAGIDALAEGLTFVLREQGVQMLTIRPGFVATKMTEGMKKPPFSTTPEKVAIDTVAAVASGRELIWVPGILRYVMWVLKLIPRPIFRRLSI